MICEVYNSAGRLVRLLAEYYPKRRFPAGAVVPSAPAGWVPLARWAEEGC